MFCPPAGAKYSLFSVLSHGLYLSNALYKQSNKYCNEFQHKDEHIRINLVNKDDVSAVITDHHTVTNLQVNKTEIEKYEIKHDGIDHSKIITQPS